MSETGTAALYGAAAVVYDRRMTRLTKLAAATLLALVPLAPCLAWEDHARLSRVALGSEPWAKEEVQAEGLERFLEAEKGPIAKALADFEARAPKELAYYPPLPPELAFKGEGSGPALRAAFLAAIRLNPDSKLVLYLKPDAGAARTRPPLPVAAVDPFDGRFVNRPFETLAEGERVAALEVLATASDEPDYGLDCGLYEDNGTEAGKRYGLGVQPFGNPALDYGSQAPVHMTFAREDPIIGLAAPFTKRSLADYRFRLCTLLARLAFAEGHPYWGCRFAGWAIHYVEDLCQPYHSSLLPGKSTLQMVSLNVFGSSRDVNDAMILLSNRHAIVEDYAYRAVVAGSAAIESALAKGALRSGDGYRAGWLYDVAAARAFARGRELDRLVGAGFPARYASDPSYDYGASNSKEPREFDPYAHLAKQGNDKAAAFEAFLAGSFSDLGALVREYAAFARDPAAKEGPRKAPFDARPWIDAAIPAALLVLVAVLIVAARRRKAARA